MHQTRMFRLFHRQMVKNAAFLLTSVKPEGLDVASLVVPSCFLAGMGKGSTFATVERNSTTNKTIY